MSANAKKLRHHKSLFFAVCNLFCRMCPTILKIDTVYLEGLFRQKVMRFSQLIFGPNNIPQAGQNIVSFGLNSSSVRVKDSQMSLIKGLLHSPKKRKCDSCALALPPQ